MHYEIDEYDERLLRHLALGYTKEQIAGLRGMPFGVKSLEKRQNELIQKLFPDGNGEAVSMPPDLSCVLSNCAYSMWTVLSRTTNDFIVS